MTDTFLRTLLLPLLAIALTAISPRPAAALECGAFSFPKCDGPDAQFAGSFQPGPGIAGFGGGDCKAKRTPVVFIHGNGDRATNWDAPVAKIGTDHTLPPRSVYQEFKNRGYSDCELFGVTYLDDQEQAYIPGNYHRPEKYLIITDFINAVKAYTGSDRVDIVTHSLGASMTLAALKVDDAWGSVRRFVNIAGGIRGLDSCYLGFVFPTCGSENIFDSDIFGFSPINNDWTGSGTEFSLREMPGRHPDVLFYTITAGLNDQIHCAATSDVSTCASGPLFKVAANVRAQLNIGAGSTTLQDSQDGGDSDGIGHMKSRINSGTIIYTMLNTDCRGLNCKGNYRGPVRAAP